MSMKSLTGIKFIVILTLSLLSSADQWHVFLISGLIYSSEQFMWHSCGLEENKMMKRSQANLVERSPAYNNYF